jgi:PKD repeat protein
MAKKLDRGIAVVLVVLIIVLLADSVSAATFEEVIGVSPDEPYIVEFTVKETGTIHAEVVEFSGPLQELCLILEAPSGERKEVWWWEVGMPLSLTHMVSEEDIKSGTDWKIVVLTGLEGGDGTLKITYPSDTTPPTITLTCSPENPPADQQITFFATASDRSGIDRIEILVNAEKVEECFESKCTYIGGPYPAGTSVSYGANAYDKAGNRAWTGYKSVYISEPRDIIPPTVIDNTPVGTDVPVTTEITITFSESMNMELTEGAFSMYDSGQLRVPGNFYWKKDMMIFKPRPDLNHDTEYVVNLEGGNRGAMDLAENIMIRSYNWGFKTSSPELISPAAIISASATEINAGEGISFSAEASSDRDGEVVSYYWDFDDGDTDTRINVEHVYSHSGHYTVTLTVTDNDKLSDTDTVDISVTIPTLSVSMFTNPVPSGESEEIIVLVFSDGDSIDGADVSLVSTIGSLHPSEGKTDESGEFVSIYTAPPVSTTQRYTISATAEKEGYEEGINSVSDSIFVVHPPLPPIVPIAIAAIAAVTVLIYIFKKLLQYKEEKKKIKEEEKQQRGAISASSDPEGSLVSLDGASQGRSPLKMDNIPIGPHIVVFAKFGYFDCKREALVTANQTKHVHCDLTEIPGIKLKLSAEPTEIPADGKSESKITIWIEDNNENKIHVPVDVTVELRTNRGKIERQIKILAGHASATATLTSSTDKGTATVEAKAEFLKGSTTVGFLHPT